MVRRARGVSSVIRLRRTPLPFLALAGALALALSVAACGRKGPLELPTSAADPAPAGASAPGAWEPQNTAAAGQAGVRPADRPNDAYVRGAPAARQPSILDRLVD
jgi:predicted small lipoprotein YifL